MRELRVSFPKPCDEKWEAMAPAGCDRLCARCDKVIHDLSHYEFDEVETLLRRDPESCVRASIDADGVVALKPGRRGRAGRMMIAVAATAGLLTAGTPVLARRDQPEGAIAGNVEFYGSRLRITATDTSGRAFRGRVKSDGRFRIRRLPAGTYRLTFFAPGCGDSWAVENVVVREGETVVPRVEDGGGCVVVGLLRIEDGRG